MNDFQQIRDAILAAKPLVEQHLLDVTGYKEAYETHALNAALATLDRMIATRGDTQAAVDWDALYKIRDKAEGKILDKLNDWLYCNDPRKTGDTQATAQPAESVGEQPKSTWDFYKSTLERFVYETTHLSPQNEDGSHDCRISKKCLLHSRIALELLGKLSQPKQPDVAELLGALKEVVLMHDNDRAVREKHIDVWRDIISRAEQKAEV